MSAKTPWWMYWVIRWGVMTGMLLSAIGGGAFLTGHEEDLMQFVGWPDSPSRAVKRQLRWAESESVSGMDEHVKPVRDFFRAARSNTRGYSEEVLGWTSKWKLVKDYVTSNEEHPQYLKERFEAMVFSEPQLDAVVEEVVATHLRHIEDVESQMLVRLEADLSNLPSGSFGPTMDRAALSQALGNALRDAVNSARGELKAAVGRELASWIAGEILTHATLQLATSSGILGTGAASGTVTFGVGVVVGLIVDAIVTKIYNHVYDPAGELAKQLDSHLYRLEELILEGNSDAPGLMPRLRDYSRDRGNSRGSALRNAVLTLAP